MGTRAHCEKRHVIEYADCESFNWRADELYQFLTNNGVQVCTYGDTCYCPWEIDVETFEGFVEKLRSWDKELIPNEFKGGEEDDLWTVEYILEYFEDWLREYDKNHDVIYIQWF